MPEGLSAEEVGKEIAERSRENEARERQDRIVSIAEAVLLSIVALMAAWSGYAAAKWSTESRVDLSAAAAARTKANRADQKAITLRNFDSSTFEAWFTAFSVWQSAGDGARRAPLPSSLPSRIRCVACDQARDQPARAARTDLYAAIPTARARAGEGARPAGRRGFRLRLGRRRDVRQVHPRRPSSWRASSSSSASVRGFPCEVGDTRSWGSAPSCWSSPSCNSPSCRVRRPDPAHRPLRGELGAEHG